MNATFIANNNNSSNTVHNDRNKHLEPPPSSSSFSEIIRNFVMGQSLYKPSSQATDRNASNENTKNGSHLINSSTQPVQTITKRTCKPPHSRKFAHPCQCTQPHKSHNSHSSTSSNNSLPPAAYTVPLHLYDPATKKCLPTSRTRDMLLKECRSSGTSHYRLPHQLYNGAPCVYDDLNCDTRRNRCVCKPSFHLYYNLNNTAFGCVPIGPSGSEDGRINCRPGYIYNVISKDCQKIFDVNELPPTYTAGVSATQFSFVSIVIIWVLLLMLIMTARFRKLRASILYRNTPSSERRPSNGTSSARMPRRVARPNGPTWLHPIIGQHLGQNRGHLDRTQTIDDSGNYNDTDLFLTDGNRRLSGILSGGNFAGSQQSINNPPPKFEEIYPTCPSEIVDIQPPSNEDLPTYDEAMKLHNTVPHDANCKD